jgi:hypothetical protein
MPEQVVQARANIGRAARNVPTALADRYTARGLGRG